MKNLHKMVTLPPLLYEASLFLAKNSEKWAFDEKIGLMKSERHPPTLRFFLQINLFIWRMAFFSLKWGKPCHLILCIIVIKFSLCSFLVANRRIDGFCFWICMFHKYFESNGCSKGHLRGFCKLLLSPYIWRPADCIPSDEEANILQLLGKLTPSKTDEFSESYVAIFFWNSWPQYRL